MANRQALKELQERLAARLREARDEAVAVAAWLAVECGERRFLLPLAQAGEIFSWNGVQDVPYTQAWFLGVANLRGVLCGVVDLERMLGAAHERSEQQLTESSVVTLASALQINVALLVQRLVGLRGVEAFVASEPPDAGAPAYFGSVYLDAQGMRWQELRLQVLAQDPVFLHIGG